MSKLTVMIMDDTMLRNVVATAVAQNHGNTVFIEQIKSGEQDDGPYMSAAYAVREWFLNQLMPAAEEITE